jgi:hypothetical protein
VRHEAGDWSSRKRAFCVLNQPDQRVSAGAARGPVPRPSRLRCCSPAAAAAASSAAAASRSGCDSHGGQASGSKMSSRRAEALRGPPSNGTGHAAAYVRLVWTSVRTAETNCGGAGQRRRQSGVCVWGGGGQPALGPAWAGRARRHPGGNGARAWCKWLCGAHQAVRDADGPLAAQRECQLRRRVGAARRGADGAGADGGHVEACGGGDLGAELGAGLA